MKGRVMGYRSEVAYTIRFDDSDKGRQTFDIFLADARQNEDTKGVFNDERSDSEGDESPLKIDYIKRHINFHASYVKWNSDYEDVKCHDALIVLAKDYISDLIQHGSNQCCMGVIFTRVGDELSDIEEDADGTYDWGWISVHRSIELDW
jgi:hypothetical protein